MSQAGSCSGLFSPHLAILEIKVVGFTPKTSAAPSSPPVFQLAASNTSTEVVTFEAFKLDFSVELEWRGAARRRIRPRTRLSRGWVLAGEGQVKIQSRTAVQNHGALNHLAQPPHVARPIVTLELSDRRPGRPGLGVLQFLGGKGGVIVLVFVLSVCYICPIAIKDSLV